MQRMYGTTEKGVWNANLHCQYHINCGGVFPPSTLSPNKKAIKNKQNNWFRELTPAVSPKNVLTVRKHWQKHCPIKTQRRQRITPMAETRKQQAESGAEGSKARKDIYRDRDRNAKALFQKMPNLQQCMLVRAATHHVLSIDARCKQANCSFKKSRRFPRSQAEDKLKNKNIEFWKNNWDLL